jgi:hypothetical protein
LLPWLRKKRPRKFPYDTQILWKLREVTVGRKVFFCVKFDDDDEAERIATKVYELSNVPEDELREEPPKLKIASEEPKLVYPEVLLVEREYDLGGRLVMEGRVVGGERRFKIEFF